MVRHVRQYGAARTDVCDYRTTLTALCSQAGAWGNSGVRKEAPQPLRDYLDRQPKPILKSHLRLWEELSGEYGFEAATAAMERSLRDGQLSASDARVVAARITGYGIDTPAETGPGLEVYDAAFLGQSVESRGVQA